MAGLIVLQSHAPSPPAWVGRCLDSVRGWALAQGHGHEVVGDALFGYLHRDLLARTRRQPVIASDLARLAWMAARLDAGATAVLWLDADTLITDPTAFALPTADHALGREVWVQTDTRGRWRSYIKVQNAAMLFRPGNPWLAFYRHAAEHIVRTHASDHMVPQIVGPKLLTALHNIVGAPVMENTGALSPAVIADLLQGDGPALRRLRAGSRARPVALNLCASSVAAQTVSEADMHAVIDRLLAMPAVLQPLA